MTFELQPVLESELLMLRPLVAGDFGALYAIAADPAVWEQHPSKDRVYEPVFCRWFDDALASGGALVAIEKGADRVIGTSRYAPTDDANAIEIGWTFLDRSHWGGTYNGEMKRMMIEHASCSFQSVVFTVHSLNVRSQKAVERLGARPVTARAGLSRTRREHRLSDGRLGAAAQSVGDAAPQHPLLPLRGASLLDHTPHQPEAALPSAWRWPLRVRSVLPGWGLRTARRRPAGVERLTEVAATRRPRSGVLEPHGPQGWLKRSTHVDDEQSCPARCQRALPS